MKNLSLILLLVLTTACGPTMTGALRVLTGFEKPKVRTRDELAVMTNETFGPQNQVVQDVFFKSTTDSAAIVDRLFLGFGGPMLVFKADGTKMCYQGDSYCGGVQLSETIKSFEETLQPCTQEEADSDRLNLLNLSDALAELELANGEPLTLKNLKPAKYYILYHWGSFVENPKRINESYIGYEYLAKKSEGEMVVLRINCDLRTDYNLKHKKKTPMRVIKDKEHKGEYLMFVGGLPYNNPK